jgi:Gluconate 2-dehydrogenase subunit 3
MPSNDPIRIDRRTALQWMLAAGALIAKAPYGFAAPAGVATIGSDPNLTKAYAPGDVWPLTMTPSQRKVAIALSDTILPADATSPAASTVGVVDFIDEWISAPYPDFREDAALVTAGLDWVDAESQRRYGKSFADATEEHRAELCSVIAQPAAAGAALAEQSRFFRRYRDLTTGGYYTTPVGMKDIGYVGNLPLATFEGPPPELIKKLGLESEVMV